MSTIDEIKYVIQILQNGGKIIKVIDFYNDNDEYLGELEIYLNPTDKKNENRKKR